MRRHSAASLDFGDEHSRALAPGRSTVETVLRAVVFFMMSSIRAMIPFSSSSESTVFPTAHKPHKRLNALFRVSEQIFAGMPCTRLTEYYDGRASKAKHRLFLATLKRRIQRVNLKDPAN